MSLRSAISAFRGHRQPHLNIIGNKRYWFALSGGFIVLSLIGLGFRGLNYSIDFKGGAQLEYPDNTGVTATDVVGILSRYGRSDALVQVKGAGSGNSQILVRTRSLNDLGGPPQTRYTFTNTAGATEDSLREALAEFGILHPRVKITGQAVQIVIKRAQEVVGASADVTIVYRPTTDLKAKDVEGTLATLGRAKAQVVILDKTVVIKTEPLHREPKPKPTPTPTPTPSPSASPSTSPGGTPSPSPTGPVVGPGGSPSPGASSSPSASSAGAAPAAGKKKSAASPKPSPKPSASPSAAPSPTPSVSPTPSPSPTGPPTPKDILEALGQQAGVDGEDILVRDLSADTPVAVVAALAERAGVQPGDVRVKDIGGNARAHLLDELATQAGTTTSEVVINDVGATWGAQISKKAVQGLIVFLILVTIYITFRFEWKMAGSALTALGHDLIITAGIYALVGREVTPETVIAILTILGYSLYDTVVIFDRVKENTESLALVARDTYSGVVNLSLNETLMRSVNTSLVVLLPIAALLLFGGETLKDFAFALFIGVASGAYSSIFVASPMLALLKEREPRYQQIRLRAARAAAGRGAPAPGAPRALRSVGGPASGGTRPAPAPAGGDGASGDGAGAGAGEAPPRTGGAKPTGGRPTGQRSGGGGGGRSKSKKRSSAAKRRRR